MIGVLMALVAATLGIPGVLASAMPTPSYGYGLSQAVSDFAGSTAAKGVDEPGVRASGLPSRRGPHGYDDRVNLASASAHLDVDQEAPNTAGLADDVVGPSVRYNRGAHYGGAQTNSPAGRALREGAEGTACPSCGRPQISGTNTAPVPEHSHRYSSTTMAAATL